MIAIIHLLSTLLLLFLSALPLRAVLPEGPGKARDRKAVPRLP